jgi:hypothetical protein
MIALSIACGVLVFMLNRWAGVMLVAIMLLTYLLF